MSVLNLDQQLTVDNKKTVQIGGKEYELIFNDKFAKLVADMQLKVAEATKDFDGDAKLEQFAKNELNDNLKTLNSNFHKQEVEIDKINDDLRRHDLKLVEHETEIHALKEESKNG